MVDINEVLEGESSRRKFLQASGAAGAGALAGCMEGDNNPEESNKTSTTQQDPTSQGGSDAEGDSGNESGQTEEGYPSQSSDGFKKAANESIENQEHAYAFEVNGMEHLNVEGIEGAGEKYLEGRESLTLEEALYVAATDAGPRNEPSEVYFTVSDPELSPTPKGVAMYPVDENGNIIQTDERGVVGYMDELIPEADDFDPDTAQSQLEAFFRERIDGDPVGAGGGIDHAVDLEDFPYAVEALQSGYDAS